MSSGHSQQPSVSAWPSSPNLNERVLKPAAVVYSPAVQPRAKFWPIFTCLHAIAVIFMFSWAIYHVGLPTLTIVSKHDMTIEQANLRGPQKITHKEPANPLMAQPPFVLIRLGALFPPCMRTDYRVNFHYSRGVGDKVLTGEEKLGCCEVAAINIAATETKEKCAESNITIWRSTACSKRGPGENNIAHALRPCCTGLDGTCHVTSSNHCWFVGGTFHLHAEHCFQVDCLQSVCQLGMTPKDPTYRQTPSLPPSYHQWWRFLSASYVPLGMMDGLLLLSVEFPFSWALERKIGWLRVLLVHTSAGAGGHLMGSLYSKFNTAQSGGGPSLAGILAGNMVHHMEVWGLVPRLTTYTLTWLASLALLFFLGTLPRQSNYATLWGFVVGFLVAVIYVPFPWIKRVTVMRVACIVILVLGVVMSLLFFYEVQPSEPCSWCRYFDCVPYVTGICD